MEEHLERKKERSIVIAGGCFWGVEEYFHRLKGVTETEAIYAQGVSENPTYEAVCSGTTGYTEAVYLHYDPNILPLESLLDHLFRIIDPTSINRQGNDIGTQYRTGIYPTDVADLPQIEAYLHKKQAEYQKPIVVECEPLKKWSSAEAYHQAYLRKNPNGYCHVDFSLLKADEVK